MCLSLLVKMYNRCFVSDRAGASIASAVLKHNEIIDEQNKELTIDRRKVKRERKKESDEKKNTDDGTIFSRESTLL